MKNKSTFKWNSLIWMIIFIMVMVFIFNKFFLRDVKQINLFSKHSVQQQLDEGMSKNIIGKKFFKKLQTYTTLATGEFLVSDVYITKEQLLENIKKLDEKKLFKTAQSINSFYQKYNIPTCIISVPSATEFYSNQLPDDVLVDSQRNQIDFFYDSIDGQIKKIDAYYILMTMSDDDYIYYRTDSRWTSYGAYCVYRSAIQKMGFSPISYDKYSIFHIKSDFKGDLYKKCFYDTVDADVLDVYNCNDGNKVTDAVRLYKNSVQKCELYKKDALDTANPYEFYLGSSKGKIILNTNVDNEKSLLIIKDSLANCFIPFLVQHYSKISIIDITDEEVSFENIKDISSYNQVLFLCDADTYENSDIFSYLLSNKEEKYD